MGSSRLKGSGKTNSKTNSRRRQNYGPGSNSILDSLKNSRLKSAIQGQITKFKQQEAAQSGALKSNLEFYKEGVEIADSYDRDDDAMMEDVLEGRAVMDNSNAGDWEDITSDYWATESGKKKYQDYRSRRDRNERRNQHFASQVEFMVDAYMDWYGSLEHGLHEGIPAEHRGELDSETVVIVDVFCSFYSSIKACSKDTYWSCSLVRNGVFPCSPGIASVGVSTRTLEVYCIQSLRCPRMSIKAFVKSICDIQAVPFKPYLQVQFSIAFDLYLNVLSLIKKRVMAALGRDSPNWRLANACPCCLYRVDGEPDLRFQLLATWDGNNSLKCLRRTERSDTIDDMPQLGKSKEKVDTRQAGGDYYLSREEVDKWSKESIRGISSGQADEAEESSCADRWKNLSKELTAKMWGVYEETGIFLSLCRHSFVLLVVDMVNSGELAKYPLAILDRLFDVIGEDIGLGYHRIL
ncbi:hypothetical protein C8R42DRAFT_637108 [Lentinula raphanica]|nr:hypothetical protein C8R42DRAFT_637108 [Lentinula raphanica]